MSVLRNDRIYKYMFIFLLKNLARKELKQYIMTSLSSPLDHVLLTDIGYKPESSLTHWGRVTHICVSKLIIIGSDNGLSPDRRQAIIWTNAGLLLIGPLGTNFTEILIKILEFSFKKMRLKLSSAKWRPFCLGLNVLKHGQVITPTLYNAL